MKVDYINDHTMDSSGFVILADYVPQIVQEIRYYSCYNFIGERIDGYEEPCALLTIEAARALKSATAEFMVMGLVRKYLTPTALPVRYGALSCGASRTRTSG